MGPPPSTRTAQPPTADGPASALRADARRNRSKILAAAEEAFASDGLSVPVDEIARRAGVGAGTLYRHFPTKEALFEAVLVEHMEGLAREAERMVDAGDSPGQALFDFIARLASEGATKRNLVDALAGAGVDIKASAGGPKARLEEAFQQLLVRAQAAGEVRSDVTLADLFGLVMGTCSFGDEDACSTRRMLTVVCDGLRVPGRPPQ